MSSPSQKLLTTALALSALGLFSSACISKDSEIIDATKGCEEFVPGEDLPSGLEVDDDVKSMLRASSSLRVSIHGFAEDVRDACGEIATDLGASDTWSDIPETGKSILNESGTGACDHATRLIGTVLRAERDRGIRFAFSVARGRCYVDYEAQKVCDRSCELDTPCNPGTVETRCEPGNLSVMCHASCNANAYCEGTASNPANCVGTCESTCQGQCTGVCVGEDGSETTNNANCRGRCGASCIGTCEGMCQITQEGGMECGASVSCRGGCSSTYSDPVCESQIGKPDCSLNESCHASCSCEVAANPICEPARVTLFASANASDDLKKVVAAINEHAGLILSAGQLRAKLAHESIQELGRTAESVSNRSGDLNGKSLACAAAASKVAFVVSAEATALIDSATKMNELVELDGFVAIDLGN